MKKIIISLTCFLFVIGVNAQSEALLGKWNIFEISMGEQTGGLETMSEEERGRYVEILADGVFNMLEQTGKDVDSGRWEYAADTKTLKVVWGEDTSTALG